MTGLGGILAFGAAPRFLRAEARGANERITFGYIGVGGMAGTHMNEGLQLRKQGRANIAAVCEIDSDRLARAKNRVGGSCKAFSDYRELLEQKDIDAVFISTPDHWHAMQTIHACEAGKHVYVEKPASCTPPAGRAMVKAARANKCAVQVGSQGRSGGPTQIVANYIQNGMIGKVHTVKCWHEPNPARELRQTEEPPANLDWDAWLGPLSMRPYIPRAYHPGSFRWMMESGGGNIRDRGAHLLSTIFHCINADGQMPVSVEATGDPRPQNTAWDIPANMKVIYTFKNPDWTLVWDQPGEIPESEQASHKYGKTFGTVFHGDKDEVILFDSGWFSEPPQKVRGWKPPAGGVNVYRMDKHGDDVGMNHVEDWLQAIQSGGKPCMDIEIAHNIAVLTYLGNMAYVSQRKLEWDTAKEEIIGGGLDHTLIWKNLRMPFV